MSGIATVASGLLEGKKYRRPYMDIKYVQIKQLSESTSIVALVINTEGAFHKFVCPGDDIIATDWEEVV